MAIVGAGFAGSLLAMIARRLGYRVVLVERGRHPRFVIGESSTPLADLLWTELARKYELPRLMPLSKHGPWRRERPELACGLKRGFTFYHHSLGQRFRDTAAHERQLLVAASPNDEVADTHWYRPDFDHFLVREAMTLGVEYLDQTAVGQVRWSADGGTLLGERLGQRLELRARFLLDATGPRGFLHGALGLPEAPLEFLPPTQALYAHFTGVRRCAEHADWASVETPPYPVDDAAVHHLFPGGWMWVLRFNNGITSAGVAATAPLAQELGLAAGAPGWQRLLERLPSVRDLFAEAQAATPFVWAPRLGFRSGVMNGAGWVLLPYAAGFIDPLLSPGFPLTLLGIARLAEALAAGPPGSPVFARRLTDYVQAAQDELRAAERLVAALYAVLGDFPAFADLALLYFAAASLAERARRCGQPELAGRFLLTDHPRFGPELARCCTMASAAAALRPLPPGQLEHLRAAVLSALAPVDVGGFGAEPGRRWFPMTA